MYEKMGQSQKNQEMLERQSVIIKSQTKIQIRKKEVMSEQKDANRLRNRTKEEQIIEYCRQKFINILPNNTQNHALTAQQKPASTSQTELSQLNTIIYNKQQVKQVMRQLSIFLQLVIQNCLLSSDTRVKVESYRILGNFRNYLSRDLEVFETMIYNRNKTKLSFFEVDCKDFMGRQIDLKLPPQVSLYQDPLLFYIYTRFAQQQLFINHPIHVSRQQRIQILKHHIPFLDPLLIPIVSERLQTKSKFSQVQDRLLLIMVKSKLDVNEYRQIYFPSRNQSQIKNRIKNLSGHTKEMNSNAIKETRMAEYMPLTEQQIQKILKGYIRFGTRWPVIAKYYNCRSSQFLEMQYTSDIKLIRRRQKQQLYPHYQSFKIVLEQRLQQINNKKYPQLMDLQNSLRSSSIMQQQKSQQHEHQHFNHDDQDQDEHLHLNQQPQYKIINHLTFQYCQI